MADRNQSAGLYLDFASCSFHEKMLLPHSQNPKIIKLGKGC